MEKIFTLSAGALKLGFSGHFFHLALVVCDSFCLLARVRLKRLDGGLASLATMPREDGHVVHSSVGTGGSDGALSIRFFSESEDD